MAQTHNPSELVGKEGWGKATQTSFKIKKMFCLVIYLYKMSIA